MRLKMRYDSLRERSRLNRRNWGAIARSLQNLCDPGLLLIHWARSMRSNEMAEARRLRRTLAAMAEEIDDERADWQALNNS